MAKDPIVVRGTEIVSGDPRQRYREKIARVTLDSMVQFVGLLDAQGTVLEINKIALDAVGIALSDVEGKPFWTTFWWQVSDEINATLRASIARAARGEFVRWDTPIYGRAGGKETIIIDASLAPVVDDAGRVVFICAEGRDITEKKAQERLIAEQNIELQGLLERIRELDEIKTQFFANVSHELRTPLTLILGPAQRLIDQDSALSASDRREGAEVIARNARMLLKHVNDLLDMSRLEAGKLTLDLKPTDVAALVRFLASHFAVLAADRRIDYAVVADEPCLAAVDADKLQRVVMNLLANAFKFVPDGGRVRCALEQSREELVISVDDSGPGVKPELRQAIFERFRQGDGGIDRKAGGTGLGLAIVTEFVEMHKGRVEVVGSTLGGARFEVTLPRHRLADGVTDVPAPTLTDNRATLDGLLEQLRPQRTPSDTSDVEVSANGERPRVLVVEDNADMNRFISQCLAKEYEVISAFDGREGLAKALRFHPALVVSDIMMPNVSGVEMIAEMRKVAALATLPILLLSAKADDRLRVKLLEEGASDFIVKPFSEHDLLVRVRNLVRAIQARAATEESLVQEQQEVELVRTIERIGSSITAEFDVHRIVQAVTDEATTLVGAQFGAFFYNVLNEQGESYTLYTLSGVAREAFSHFPMPRNTAVFAPTFHGTSVVRSGDITKDARYGHNAPHHGMPAGHLPVRSYLAVPVVSHNQQVMGGLFFGHERPDMFTDRHERLVVGIAGWAAVAMDNAQLYESQLRARAELEQALEAAHAARSEAERANLAKSQFLASMSHELRTPLNAIQGHVQLLEMGLHGPITEIQRETLERVQRSQRALQSLINDVLNFARLEAGRVEYFIQPVMVRETVTAVLQMVEPQLTAKSLTYSANIPPELRVAADPDKLRQILLNLLSNAIKFTEPGGKVTVDSAHREGVPREIVFVRVADTGCGIARPKQDEIFDPFVQVHRQHSVSAGIGLGLAISRDLARGMGGDLRVRSDEGGGSVFTLTLPRA